MASKQPADSFGKRIRTKLVDYSRIRHQRYEAVNVLLISWKDDDTDSATEIEQLQTLFQETFNYTARPYQIPSTNSQASLNLQIASFLHSFTGSDNLLVIYYGGHGGPRVGQHKSPCTWAATNAADGPSLDWSLIQPSLLGADCDVAIILDCCYAGQAARSSSAQTIELLAATDADNWTPNNASSWPTFTRALIRTMEEMMERDEIVTLRGLAKHLSASEAGLRRQPFHVSLGGDRLAGPIKLPKLRDSKNPHAHGRETTPADSLQLKLSFFEPLNFETFSALIRWMTKDSPSSVADIQYADQALTEANNTGKLCNQLLANNSHADGQFLSFLSRRGQEEGLALLSHLRSAMSSPTSIYLTDSEAKQIIKTVKQRSQDLVIFIEDSIPRLNKSSLRTLEAGKLFKVVNQDLKDRINMRLTLIAEDMPNKETEIAFDITDPPRSGQQFRTGSKHGKRVLVEYFSFDETKSDSETSNLRQVRRISALHVEVKGREFHTMRGAGFLRESLRGIRYGIIYQVPEEKESHFFSSLSHLISNVTSVPLEIRMRTAYALCEALLNLHSVGWYHKAIKSENVLCFRQGSEMGNTALSTAWELQCPYLVGFDCSRPLDAESRTTVDFSTRNNIYKHPDRWDQPRSFQRHHDIYALGILLLEVGCWKRLETMSNKIEAFEHFKKSDALRLLLLGSILDKCAHAAGTQFASAVRFCLEERQWSDLEEWQVQKMMRQSVLEPLRACFS